MSENPKTPYMAMASVIYITPSFRIILMK